MGYSRNVPMGTGIDPDVVAAIASDPEGYKARKKDLEASIMAAQAVIDEAASKKAEQNAREQALNDRETVLAAREKQLKEAFSALAVERAADEARGEKRRKDNDARSVALTSAETAQKAQDDDSRVKNAEAATALKQAEAYQSAAATLRAKLEAAATVAAVLSEKLKEI